MKILGSPDLDSWTKNIICNCCHTSLEIDETDLFCLYRDLDLGTFNTVLVNGDVTYYCTCMNCESRVKVQEIPQLIQSRVEVRYPPPVRLKKKWYQTLFGV